MKRNLRLLWLSLAVAAALGCVLAAMLLIPPGEQDASSVQEESDVVILQGGAEDISRIDVKNSGGSYAFIPDPDKTSGFTIEGMEEQELQDGFVQYATEDSYKLSAARDFGERDDLAEYGLEPPSASYVIAYKDGTTRTVRVGLEVPGETGLYYVALSGSSRVYSAEVYELLLASPLDYIQTTLASAPSSGADSEAVTLHIGGSIWPEEVTIQKNPDYEKSGSSFSDAQFIMKTPIYAACGGDGWDTLSAQLTRVAAERAVSTDLSDLKKYGLDEPRATVSYTLGESKISLLVGNEVTIQDGENTAGYYIMAEGGRAIFEIAQSSVSAWTDGDFYKLTAENARTFKLEDIARIQTSMQGETHTFTCEPADGSGSAASEWTVTADGKALTYTNFEKYFSMLSSVRSEGMPENPVSGQPVLTVTLYYLPELNAEPCVIRFYGAEGRRCNVVYNDEQCYVTVRESFVEGLMENTRRCAEDREVSAISA